MHTHSFLFACLSWSFDRNAPVGDKTQWEALTKEPITGRTGLFWTVGLVSHERVNEDAGGSRPRGGVDFCIASHDERCLGRVSECQESPSSQHGYQAFPGIAHRPRNALPERCKGDGLRGLPRRTQHHSHRRSGTRAVHRRGKSP